MENQTLQNKKYSSEQAARLLALDRAEAFALKKIFQEESYTKKEWENKVKEYNIK